MKKWPLIILISIFILSTAIWFFHSSYQDIIVTPLSGIGSTPTPTPDPLRPVTVLLLGYGGGSHDGGKLSDTLIALRIDPKLKNVTTISLPRDLWVPLPIGPGETLTSYKINAALAIGSDDRGYPAKPPQYTGEAGGGQLAKYAASYVLGFPVEYFAALSFRGFTKSIDVLGGVDVTIPFTFADPYYPLEGKEEDPCGKAEEDVEALTATLSGDLLEHEFSCRYEQLTFEKGKQHLDGITALKYVRSRHSPVGGNDFGRAARQRALLVAVRDRILSVGFLPKAVPFISTLTGEFETDITIDTLNRYLAILGDLKEYTFSSIDVTTDTVLVEARGPQGQYILHPKDGIDSWDGFHAYINKQLTATSVSPSTLPK